MQLDLERLLGIARRWWWIAILTCLIGATGAYILSRYQERLYTADATLLLSPAVDSAADFGSVQVGQSLTETYRTWAVSRPVLESASHQLSLAGGPGDFYWSQVSADIVPGTLFIRIYVTDPDQTDAAEIANAVADAFVEDVRVQSQTQAAATRARVEERLEELSGQMDELDASIDPLQASQQPLPEQDQSRLDALLGSRSRLQEEVRQLQSTASSLSLSAATAGPRVSISAPASAPVSPSSPQATRMTLMGASIGLAVGAAAIILREYFDKRIRSPEDLKAITTAPLLATIGQIPSHTRGQGHLFTMDTSISRAADSIRVLRENLLFVSAATPFTTLAVTSPGTAEGKSTLVANLGVVMARAQLRTLIIDADLRRPVQHRMFGVSNDAGLSSFLARDCDDWSELVVRLNVPGLCLLPSGPIPPTPADLLRLDWMVRLLDSSAVAFDIVLIDTSPTLMASDALSVASRSDATIVVCRLGETQRGHVSGALAALEKAAPRILGLVLTGHEDAAETSRYIRYHQSAVAHHGGSRGYGADRSAIPRFEQRGTPQVLEILADRNSES